MEEPSDTIQDFEDYSILLADYSMPFGSENPSPTHDTHESLTQSQYAKVVFRDIEDSYPTDADVSCHYSLTCGIEVQEGDFVGVFRVGWNDVNEALLKHPALSPTEDSELEYGGNKAGQVLFRADALPKDDQEFYQLCYVNAGGFVCGASVPFQFRRPSTEELCAIEGESEMVVVRSRTAVAEEKVRKVECEKEEAQREKSKLAAELELALEKLAEANLETETWKKQVETVVANNLMLQDMLESGRQRDRQFNKMQQDIHALDEGKSQTSAQLRHSQQHVKILNATVETLSVDKARMASLLRESVKRGDEVTAQLQETQAKLQQAHEELQKSREEKAAMETKYKADIAELRQAHDEVQSDLLRQLTSAREVAQDAARQKQDLTLLREHRANLERQLEILDERHKKDQTDWRARELDLVGRIGITNQQLVQLKQQQNPVQQPRSSEYCNQCETAGVQLSLLEAQVKDLQQRLDKGAEEYRKIYTEKCRVEKKLAKQSLPSKLSDKPAAVHSAPTSPRTVSSMSGKTSCDISASGTHNCPMCGVTFPPGSSDLFTQHFDNHLS